MKHSKAVTFFYGSYMNPQVLRDVGIVPDRFDAAWLPGYDIEIRPVANLLASDQHTVFGVLARTTHAELSRLYAHARDVLGGEYFPQAVLAHHRSGPMEPALCYIAPELEPGAPSPEYIERIVSSAREYAFPSWYLHRLESFLDA